MTLQHHFWDFVSMITHPHGQVATGETVLAGRVQDETSASENALVRPSNTEAEISQLTWAVLDGKATLAERQRLAQLVSEQHQRRDSRS